MLAAIVNAALNNYDLKKKKFKFKFNNSFYQCAK